MEMRDAVQKAKTHVFELFDDEGIADVGLEEIALSGDYWEVTIGFSRAWDRSVGSALSGKLSRSYNLLLVNNEDGSIGSVRDRILDTQR